jgi:hypothetical protein
LDSKISPSDEDDLEIFEDAIFDSPWGRVHIYFYEWLFENYYQSQTEVVIRTFVRYLDFLNEISPLFTIDAFNFVFRKNDIKLVENLLNLMTLETKLNFIKASDKYPEVVRSVPKLKLYNLFS